MSLDYKTRVRSVALTLLASLAAGSAWHASCPGRPPGDPWAALAPAASLAPAGSLAPAPPTSRQPPPPPRPLTCWDQAKSPDERHGCAQAELEAADRNLNAVYAEVLAEVGPGLHQAIRSAERAWLRYRDAHLSSLVPTEPGASAQPEDEMRRLILLTRLTRGRVGELRRMLPPDPRDPATDEASCEGPPADCEHADQWVEKAYGEAAKGSPPADRRRLEAAQAAWLGYVAAETATVLASQPPFGPRRLARIRAAVRARLSGARMAHLATFVACRQGSEERCQEPTSAVAMLARLEAECDTGLAQACKSLGGALEWGWHGIDRDAPRARSAYRKACEAGNGAACASLAFILNAGRGVVKDPEQAARFLERGCDAGDAENCQSLALAVAAGDGVPKDVGKAIELWEHACTLSLSDRRRHWPAGQPCQRLARAFESGDEIPQDLGRALELHEEACERQEAGSCVDAARLLRREASFDVDRVIELYRKACSANRDAAACVELGDLYRNGDGIPHDRDAATESYQSACQDGFVPGCRALSAMTGAPMGDPDDPVPDPGYIRTVRFVAADDIAPLRVRLFGDDYGTILRLQVLAEGESAASQEILIPESEGSEPGAKLPLSQVDLNFDGYKDVTLMSWQGAQNYGQFIWLFDPRHRRFVYCPELSGLSSLEADPEKRLLRSYYHFSATQGAISEYQWIRGKAELVREESSYYVEKDGTRCLEYIKKEWVGGRLVETERSCS